MESISINNIKLCKCVVCEEIPIIGISFKNENHTNEERIIHLCDKHFNELKKIIK